MLFDDVNKCLQKYPKLSYDEACIDVINFLNDTITVYYQYDECYQCDFQELATLKPLSNTSVVAKTSSPIQLYAKNRDSNNTSFCLFQKLLYEHWHYGWNITQNAKCPFYIIKSADNAYLPILMAFIVLFCFGTIWYMVKCIYRNSSRLKRFLKWNSEIEEDLGGSISNTPLVEKAPKLRKHPNRIKSIDVFRGLCIILMIFVNYGGGQYWFFKHSVWNGITIADLVFPWFLWLMGLSLTISVQSKLRRAVPRGQMMIHILKRSFILLLLGIIINSNKNSSTIADLRFPGVLQRIAITYFIVGLMEVQLTKRIELENISWFYDITSAWIQWVVMILITIIHTSITFGVFIPDCGKGYLGPGGLEEHGKYFNCTGGVAGFIDRSIFGNHMYKHPTCQKVYENRVFFDPEGILGTLTSILTVYMGVQAGRMMSTIQNVRGKVLRWIAWGLLIGLLGGALCSFTRDDGPIPLNKQLWSLSFTLVTAGMAFIIQAGLFVVVDILKKWGGRPFFYPGMNAIILYVGHEIMRDTFPFAWIPTQKTHGTYLFMNLWGTFLWVSISIFLYKRNIFFKV